MGTSPCLFNLTADGAGTTVNWKMTSDMNQSPFIFSVMGKWFCVLGVMDKMAGGEFEKSLANMKKLAESPEVATYAPELKEVIHPNPPPVS